MTNCTENNNNVSSSSSPTPTEVPESFSAFENLVALKRELAELNQGIRSYVYRRGRRVIENWGPPRFFIPNNALEDNISMSGDEKGCFFYLIILIIIIIIIYVSLCLYVSKLFFWWTEKCWHLVPSKWSQINMFCLICQFYCVWMSQLNFGVFFDKLNLFLVMMIFRLMGIIMKLKDFKLNPFQFLCKNKMFP